MSTKIIIAATVAALSLATTAFAGEGEGRSQQTPSYSFADSIPASNTGASQYQGYSVNQPAVSFDNTTLPQRGQNGSLETANSLPRGFENGTVTYTQAQSMTRWAQQADHRYALRQAALNASRG